MGLELASVRVVRASNRFPKRNAPQSEEKIDARARRSIYLAWVSYQRRAESMQKYFGYDLFYISSQHVSLVSKLMSYFARAKVTLQILFREKPDVVWLQLPPTFLIHLLVLFCVLARHRMEIVADCHNAALRTPWSVIPLSRLFLNRATLVLVHNHDVVPIARDLGIDPPRLSVLGDCVPVLPPEDVATERPAKPTLVMPCSFHPDEPIEAVLQAARQLDSATFVITGNHQRVRNRKLLEQATANVIFAGFLPLVEFDQLLLRASGVLCLTTLDGIQLSAASEAIAAGKPMIVSDTKLLRDLFGPSGIFVDNSALSIVQGCRTAIERYGEYAAAARAMRDQRMARWLEEAGPLRLRLSVHPP